LNSHPVDLEKYLACSSRPLKRLHTWDNA